MTWRAGDAECDESKPGGSPRLTAGQIGPAEALASNRVAYFRFTVFAVAAKSARTVRARKILPNKRAGLRNRDKQTFMHHSSR
jgi:hypothetical protein